MSVKSDRPRRCADCGSVEGKDKDVVSRGWVWCSQPWTKTSGYWIHRGCLAAGPQEPQDAA